ncbi:CD74 molecule, major histocompatibility complex, class II invariant chain a [Notolabrus celidotus]|uniref:CD74 molecule, major histocompatibility complex, class II invariant chain a n=1 Tax=Notolabrus celidotus TaxID=1203425 RepID=UPI00148FA9AC|nr:CD74 molecule, major histocompatibility complex, class II invariant chain a [Notolabrus celidotus]
MDNPPEQAPLARGSVAGSEEDLIPPAAPIRTSNSRALKIAGLTTLACMLLASQVFTAYMVFSQKQQIHTLKKASEKLGRQLTRSSNVATPMKMHMPSLPLMMDYVADDVPKTSKTSKTPLTKLQDTVISVEKQVKDLMKDSPLPQFNETFLANLQGLEKQMNKSEWQSLETWMRYWLIFQMAQKTPVAPTAETAPVIQSKCQLEAVAKTGKLGDFRPQCDEQGKYLPMQCWYPTGYCWCVDESGVTIEGTAVRGRADCQKGGVPRRAMISPLLLQKTVSIDDQ